MVLHHSECFLVDDDKAVTSGDISLAITEVDVIYGLADVSVRFTVAQGIAMNSHDFILDVADVGYLAATIDNIDIGVDIGNKEQPVLPIIIDIGDAIVG